MIQTLRGVLDGEALRTFQLDQQRVFDENIGKEFSDRAALIGHCKRGLGSSPDATESEFCEQSALVDIFDEAGAKRAGDFKDSAKHALGQQIESTFSVHRKLLLGMCRPGPIPLRTFTKGNCGDWKAR